ncbi:CRASP family complement regulator-acquiring lipoprotein [Borreliella bissettiae]|nr:CRASP family complement regulator-acquiring lipoprotein [Borreliella bissettiae]
MYPKKDNLEKLEISALKRLKYSLENFSEEKNCFRNAVKVLIRL